MADQIYFLGDKKLFDENQRLQGQIRDLESNLQAAFGRIDSAEGERDQAYADRAAADNRVERAAKIVADLHASFAPKLAKLVEEKEKPDYTRLAMQELEEEQNAISDIEMVEAPTSGSWFSSFFQRW